VSTYAERRTKQQTEEDERVLANVKRGIALLQREHGPDWVEKIDLALLRLENGGCCVLGQVYGDYVDGCEKLGIDSCAYDDTNRKGAGHFGFYANGDVYDSLNLYWQQEIAALKGE
jgi:hypothetical protein